jgi:HEAT repeat protein
MQSLKIFGTGVALLALGALSAVQIFLLQKTNLRVEALEARLAELQTVSASTATPGGGERSDRKVDFSQRLAELESIMAGLSGTTNQLAGRGHPGFGTNRLEELRRTLLDPAAADKDRLLALRSLRRNHGLTDDVLQAALGWLQTSQDKEMRREILQQLDGVTNAALRQPLLDLAANGGDSKVRAEAVQNLRPFASDPEVEKRLWELAQNDADPKVREHAEEALRKGPMTSDRAARLQQLAADPQAALDDRLTAMRALVRAGVDVSGASAAVADLVQNTQDPVARAKIFRALDGVQDPRIVPPLVNGLQDPSPVVRREATETLSRFAFDPNVRQWLEYLAQSDADSRVRREAFQALKRFQEGRR